MMKIYEVKIEKVSADWVHKGWEQVALTLTEEKANEIAKAKAKEIIIMPTWWMTYGHTGNFKPFVKVVELGEVVE